MLNGGKVLITGGELSGGGAALASAELFDPSTGGFSFTATMTTGRWGHTATLLYGGQVLVAGGGTAGNGLGALASAELYQPR